MNTLIGFSLDNVADAKRLLFAWAQTQPRLLGMLMMLPVFNQQLIPSLLRFALAGVFGLIVAPALLTPFPPTSFTTFFLLVMVLKEAFVGYVIGYVFATPFWLFQAIGFVIDNQRGATIGSTLDPLLGNDTSPMGGLFLQAFIVFFMISGGMQLVLSSLYNSFLLWPPAYWMPHFSSDGVPYFLGQVDRLMRLAVLFASPVLLIMFLAEIGLGLISRFVPQLQVFFIAMPVKSGLAFLVLTIYLGVLFGHAAEVLEDMRGVVPFLNVLWRSKPL